MSLSRIVMWSEPLRQLLVHLGNNGPDPQQVWRDAAAIVGGLREFIWWRIIALLAGILLSRAWLPAWVAQRMALADTRQ